MVPCCTAGQIPGLLILLATISPLCAQPTAPTPPSASDHGNADQVLSDMFVAILGLPVAAPNGEQIGRLVDVLVDSSGTSRAAVIDFGGFLGVGSRKIAVRWTALRFTPRDVARPITLSMTPDQIKAAPDYKDPGRAAAAIVPATPPPPTLTLPETPVMPSSGTTDTPAGTSPQPASPR